MNRPTAITLMCTLAALLAAPGAVAQQTKDSIEQYFDRIYQVVVIETDTNNKNALGSGFQVTEDGYIVTNFHVISRIVFEPEHHRIEYLDTHGQAGTLSLIDFDVVHDVALLKAENVGSNFLPLKEGLPSKGDRIFAVGNPHDYGMLVVDGTYNGLAENSYIERILYSGSLNSGMSGGPAINTNGEVVGVNVATAGSQLSFLVPGSKAMNLLEGRHLPVAPDDYMSRIAEQITDFQKSYYDKILAQDWPSENLRDVATVLGEFASDVSCWGRSNEEDRDAEFFQLTLSCFNANNIFLKPNFNSGQLHFSFYYYDAKNLSARRFYDLIGGLAFQPDNRAGRSDVTRYECNQTYLDEFQQESEPGYRQAALCLRAYRNIEGVYDALFYLFQGRQREALISHFTLSGVDRESAMAYAARFVEQARWK